MAERGQSHQEGSVVCVGDNFFYRMTEGNIWYLMEEMVRCGPKSQEDCGAVNAEGDRKGLKWERQLGEVFGREWGQWGVEGGLGVFSTQHTG